MTELAKIKNIIYQYFPQNKVFLEPSYQESIEHQKLLLLKKRTRKLNFERMKLKQVLQNEFVEYEILDCSNLPEQNCFEFKILLHPNQSVLDDDVELMSKLGGLRRDIYQFTSILGKYCYFFIQETSIDKISGEWSFRNIDLKNGPDVRRLMGILELEGYKSLSDKIADRMIDNVETELKSSGEAKVFHLLFTDLIDNFVNEDPLDVV
ncbi:hypothetical protein [Shimazuella kribbensis]|uniref:hypothetical protein n=1 Tax=Shimazuella kribbensis TaxID=139808 RepID=UPI00041FE5DF|nr:hypothetical protein [Shimazuella kribbensis]